MEPVVEKRRVLQRCLRDLAQDLDALFSGAGFRSDET